MTQRPLPTPALDAWRAELARIPGLHRAFMADAPPSDGGRP